MIVSLFANDKSVVWYDAHHLNNYAKHRKARESIKTLLATKVHRSWRSYDLRQTIIAKSSWFLITEQQIAYLANALRDLNVIEIAAGTGYLATALRSSGVRQYRAIDSRQSHYTKRSINYGVEYLAFEDLPITELHSYDAVVMTWAPYADTLAANVVKSMCKGQLLYLQGESEGGCTGDDELFQLLATQFEEIETELEDLEHPQWNGIHDRWTVWRKI